MKTSRSKSARTPRRPNSGISLEDEPEFESIISHGPNVYVSFRLIQIIPFQLTAEFLFNYI